MSRRDPNIVLQQMHDYAVEANQMVRGRVRDDLESDRQMSLALTRLMEIIGEAANRIPLERQEKLPTIPWRALVGLRNRFIHGYDDVDHDILWDTVVQDLPPLIGQLQAYLSERS